MKKDSKFLEKNNKNNLYILIIVITIIAILVIGTYALVQWTSTENTELTLRIGETSGLLCSKENDISVSNMGPVFDYEQDGEITEFTVLNYTGTPTNMSATLIVDTITDNLKSSDFKYVVMYSEDEVNYFKLSEGNFSDVSNRGRIELFTNQEISGDTYYKVIFYIDGNNVNSLDIQNGSLTGAIYFCGDVPPEAVLVTDEVLSQYTTTTSGTVNYEYTTPEMTEITLAPGTYKLEVWGAQGGGAESATGGKGGYSYGTLNLTEQTNIYVYVGGQGATGLRNINHNPAGGFNGGGSGTYWFMGIYGTEDIEEEYAGGGGGASDIRIGQDNLYARVIVAGGGGGGWYSFTPDEYNYSGKVGGGAITTGLSTFGIGDSGSSSTSSISAGGGGWYGGARNRYGGYGGSGYVYTSSTASSYPSGCLLDSSYYLTDAATVAGNTSFTDFNGSTVTGHSGNGAVRISGTAEVVGYTIPRILGLTDLEISKNANYDLNGDVTYECGVNATECTFLGTDANSANLSLGDNTIYYYIKDSDGNEYKYARNVYVKSIITAVSDLSGSGNDGIVYGNAAINSTELVLDGTDDYIKLPTDLGVTFPATYSVKFKTNSTNSQIIFGDYTTKATLGLHNTNSIFIVSMDTATVTFNTGGIELGTYYTVDIVYNSLTDIKLYLNGTEVTANTTTNNWTWPDTYSYLGRRSSGDYVDGAIEKFIVYDDVLTADEISHNLSVTNTAICNTGIICDNLKLYYNFKEDNVGFALTTVSDLSGKANDGTGYQVALFSEGLYFNGADAYISLPLDVVSSFPATYSLKFKPTDDSINQLVFGDYTTKATLGLYSNNSIFIVSMDTDTVTFNTGGLELGTFYNVDIVYNSLSDIKLYINGTEITANTTTNNWSWPDTYSYIGRRSSGNYFSGTIERFIMYSDALTAEEVSHNLSVTSTEVCNDGIVCDNLELYYNFKS